MAKKARIGFEPTQKDLYIDVTVKTDQGFARAVMEGSHTNLVLLEKNNQSIFTKEQTENNAGGQAYKQALKQMTIADFADLVERMDDDDFREIRRGVDMNLEIAGIGQKLHKVGYYISDLMHKGYLLEDVFSAIKILTASAADARMAGLSYPVMSSGGSGNQGIVAILVPWKVGEFFHIEESKIIRSIATVAFDQQLYQMLYRGPVSALRMRDRGWGRRGRCHRVSAIRQGYAEDHACRQ